VLTATPQTLPVQLTLQRLCSTKLQQILKYQKGGDHKSLPFFIVHHGIMTNRKLNILGTDTEKFVDLGAFWGVFFGVFIAIIAAFLSFFSLNSVFLIVFGTFFKKRNKSTKKNLKKTNKRPTYVPKSH
jgi:hypothetical protein